MYAPTPMHNLLDHLISKGEGEDGVPVQLQFKLGQPCAGGLRKGPVEGTFQFTTVVNPGPNAPQEVRDMGEVVIHQYFEPSAIQQVIVQDQSGIAASRSRIITGAH